MQEMEARSFEKYRVILIVSVKDYAGRKLVNPKHKRLIANTVSDV